MRINYFVLTVGGKIGDDRHLVRARPNGFWKGQKVGSADRQRRRRYDASALCAAMAGVVK